MLRVGVSVLNLPFNTHTLFFSSTHKNIESKINTIIVHLLFISPVMHVSVGSAVKFKFQFMYHGVVSKAPEYGTSSLENQKGIYKCSSNIVSWEPEGCYYYSKMFRWEPEGRYCHRLSTAIAPFWFSTDHLWILIAPFWLLTDDMFHWEPEGHYCHRLCTVIATF